MYVRELGLQSLDKTPCWIGRIADTKDNLEFRPGDQRMAPDRLIEVLVNSANRFENRDARVGGWTSPWRPNMRQTRDDAKELISRRRRTSKENQNQTARRATPQATRIAAAQRLPPTCSCRYHRASAVSSTKLTAVAGTAKLRSAVRNRNTKDPNDTAMQSTLRIIRGCLTNSTAASDRPA